jgi:hypothetical protein
MNEAQKLIEKGANKLRRKENVAKIKGAKKGAKMNAIWKMAQIKIAKIKWPKGRLHSVLPVNDSTGQVECSYAE